MTDVDMANAAHTTRPAIKHDGYRRVKNDQRGPSNYVSERLETVVEEENSHSERGGRRKHTKKTEEEDKSVALSKKKRNRLGKDNKTKQPKSFHKGKGTGWRVAGVIVKYVRVGRQGYLERAPIQTKVAGSGDTSGISQGDLKEHTGSDFPENTILNSTGSSFNTELQSTTGFGHNTELQSTTAFGHNTEHQNGGPTLDIQPQQYNSISESQISPQNFETKSSEMYHSSNRDHSPSGLPSSLTGRRSADSTRSTSSLLSTGSNSMEYGRPQSSSTPKTYTSGSTIGKSNFKTEESLVTRAGMKPGLLSAGHTVRTTTPDRTHPSVSRLHDSGTGGTPNGSGILDCMSSGIEEDIASSRCSVSSGMLDEACSQIEHRTVPGTQPHYQALEDRGGAEKSGILTPAQQRQENEELRKQLIHESHLKEKAKAELESIQNEFDKLQDFLHHNSDWEGQYQQVQTELKVSRLNNDEKDQMIESLQTEVKSLRNDINSFEKEKSELMMETEELNSKIHSMETQLDEAQHEVKWEENNSMSLESQVESLQIEMSQLKEEYNKVLEDKDSLEGEVLSLTSQMEDANLPIDRSKIGESRAKTPDSQASTASYSNSEDKLATLRSEIKVWKEKHNHLNTEKRIMQKKFETTARELENAKKCVKRLESSAQSMASKDADEVRRLASGKESLEQELKVVKSLAEVRQKQAESLQKELDTLRKLAEDRQKEIRSLQQNLRSSQKLAKGREHEIDSLQQELVGASGLAEDRNRQLEQIVHEMEESKIMAENKHDQLESLQEQLNNINVVAKDKSKEVESLKAELDKATKWAEDKQLELETLEQELVGTTLVAEGRQKQIDSLQTIVAIDLCETSSEHTMESSSHAQKLTLLLAENRANREEIEKLTRDLTVKMKESAADREVNEYLCNEKYKLQSEKTILESELATVKDEYEKYQIQHSADSKIQQAEISGLKAKLNASERLKDTLTSELSHTKFNLSEASESSDKVSSVSYDLASAKVDLENLRKEHSVLNTMLAEERKQCEKLREEWQKELTEKRKLNDQIRDVKIELDTTTATLEASKDYAAQLQEEKDQLYKEYTIVQLRAEVLLQTAEQNYHAALESKSQIGVDLKMMENTISTLKAQLAEERANRKLAEQKLNSFSEMLEQERKKKLLPKSDTQVVTDLVSAWNLSLILVPVWDY
uniref:Myosin-9-like n=1 Tax=Saccoglossus kowalevskii TaxID=10224 RepID=A0ABM0MZH5_SACKO|nr:PREDICTED: myosin-9-like [Saccoglossus kowalevskii]